MQVVFLYLLLKMFISFSFHVLMLLFHILYANLTFPLLQFMI